MTIRLHDFETMPASLSTLSPAPTSAHGTSPAYRYITTPIYYANDRPHLGHFYTTVACDILARFFRLTGAQVKMTTGTDEHGDKIAQMAHKQGQTPQAYVDAMAQTFQEMFAMAGVCPDDVIRTTEPRHIRAAQALWTALRDRGHIYLGHYEGWYSVRDEAFYQDAEVTPAPDGTGKIGPTGAPVQWVQEPCYFFRLSQWQQPLLEYYARHPASIGPESRRNEVIGFLQGGLQDLAISRSRVSWGIPVPDAPGHVMYVWIDALTNYLTVLGYPDQQSDEMHHFWPTTLHVVGKDILRFHAVYWPAFLMALDIAPPARIFAHGWWMAEGQKMSKSLGNVIDPQELVARYGLDRVRYFLFRHVRFGNDGDCVRSLLVARCNQELSDRLGNLAHRVLSFVFTRLDATLPPCPRPQIQSQAWASASERLCQWMDTAPQILFACMDAQDLYGYLECAYEGLTLGNQYMSDLAPWMLYKQAQTGDTHAHADMIWGLRMLVTVLRNAALMFWPFMPDTAARLWAMTGAPARPFPQRDGGAVKSDDAGVMSWADWQSQADPNTQIVVPEPAPLFTKLDLEP